VTFYMSYRVREHHASHDIYGVRVVADRRFYYDKEMQFMRVRHFAPYATAASAALTSASRSKEFFRARSSLT